MNNIIKKLNTRLGYTIYKDLPRGAVEYAEKLFNNKKIDMIEIGVAEGINSWNVLNTLNIKKLYLVDDYKFRKEYKKAESWEKIAKDNLKGFKKQITWIKKSSNLAYQDIKEKVDFIYIDGSHDYKSVLSDLENYYPLLKKEGIIAGHDITTHRGVLWAVCDFCAKNNLRFIIKNADWVIV